jgi:predicted nicotinamide N-methyase
MSQSDEDGRREEDPFWEIALNYDGRGQVANAFDNDDDGDSDGEEDHALSGKRKTYHLPNSSVSLELAPLVSDDGVWSPVGDHAWYSSALLTCLILQGTAKMNEEDDGNNDSDSSDNKRTILDDITGRIGPDQYGIDNDIRVLELGSGAIGLSGISFAVALAQRQDLFPSWTVSLTDNDNSLLKQLEANVRYNIVSENIVLSSTDDATESSGNKNIEVEYLDWDLRCDGDSEDDENENDDEKFKNNNNQERLLSADIVIGSELVYTGETAHALVKILLTLLDRNPAVKIWIVQVTDRYGWREIVIPALECDKNINIENIPLTYDIHEMASTMIPMGGALDRYAFGAFCISNASKR